MVDGTADPVLLGKILQNEVQNCLDTFFFLLKLVFFLLLKYT